MALILFLIIVSLPLLFFKLGQSSLAAWDEAWYAEIARNIIKSGEFFVLKFNGGNYFDHPPAGFWFIALGQYVFGENSFGVRVGSALFGLLTVVTTYLLGKKMFDSKFVGLLSGISLLSAPWFVARARSGNLDIFLTFFFVLTIYLAIQASEQKKYVLSFFVSLAFLFLTKTMIPFTIIPALVLIFWKTDIGSRDFLKSALVFSLPIFYWIYKNYSINPVLFLRNYAKIGLTGVSESNNYKENLILLKTYAHNGIGNWFRTSVLFSVVGVLFVRSKYTFILAVIIASIFAPFALSAKSHIWHMIPAYPFMFLLMYGSIDSVSNKFGINKFMKIAIMVLVFLLLFVPQTKRNWYEFIDVPAYVSDEEILAKEASHYPYDLLLDDDFVPTVVYYSGKKVERTVVPLREYFDSDRKFMLIVREHRLGGGNVRPDEYEVIKKDRDKLLIIKN